MNAQRRSIIASMGGRAAWANISYAERYQIMRARNLKRWARVRGLRTKAMI